MSQNATFKNISAEPFTGWWDGKPKTFKPGEEVFMPSWLAEHFAKHLTNQELIKIGKDSYTSPKKPEDVPVFMEIFNKCFIPAENEDISSEIDGIIATARVEEPSMNIEVIKPKPINNGPAAAQRAAAQADPLIPTDHEVGPGNGSTIIGEAEEDEYDVAPAAPEAPAAAPVANVPSIPVGPAPQA